jgi:hypothetical protein
MLVYSLNRPVAGLLVRACQVLGMTQKELGEALDASHSTAHRWIADRATPSVPQVRKLTALVYPHDKQLAAELAAAASATLEGLGLVQPPAPPPPPPAPPPPLPTELVVDSLVCAAAEALDVPPRTVRAAIFAAFDRARRLRLTVDDVAVALGPPPTVAPPPAFAPPAEAKRRKGGDTPPDPAKR